MSKNKVLIVDDDTAVSDLLCHTLRIKHAIDTECAGSLSQAVATLESRKDEFFLAVLDLKLPDAPNGEIVDSVLAYDIPVIVITGSDGQDSQQIFSQKPILDYVVKRDFSEIEYIADIARRLLLNPSRKVLVVDDSMSARKYLKALLEHHRLDVITAVDGIDALEKITANRDICVTITDYNMPNMDGLQLISNIRKKYTRHEMAVLGISSQGKADLAIKLLKSGANDFISRPFIPEELYCRLNHAIDAIDSYRRLRDATTRDFLTNLFNRKYVFESGTKLFNNARRKNISLTVAMLDIDFFKKINDTYGHDLGDQALKHVSSILMQQFRDGDIVARMGGEEFCVLCVNIGEENVDNVFERVRSQVENQPLVTGDVTIPITISIGFCMELGESVEDMIKHADEALYHAKNSGRNRVSRYPA